MLFDAHAACRAIASFTEGKDFTQYTSDALLRSAVERQFEIVGEALGRAIRLGPDCSRRLRRFRGSSVFAID